MFSESIIYFDIVQIHGQMHPTLVSKTHRQKKSKFGPEQMLFQGFSLHTFKR